MDYTRRNFLRAMAGTAALFTLPVGLRGGETVKFSSRKISVMVLRRECFDDLQSRYLCDPESGPCRRFATGSSFNLDLYKMPSDFCPRAWYAIKNAVEKGACSAGESLIVSCPDGTRPVIFKVDVQMLSQQPLP